MRQTFAALALGAIVMGAAPSPPPVPAIISQSFADRAARLDTRITDDASRHLLAVGQEPLLRAQMDSARRANAAHDTAAGSMLDVIDRQLAAADYSLSRAEAGEAIAVHVGDTVTVAMHDTGFYNVHFSNPDALMLYRGVMFIRGVQGAYAAKKPAVVTVTVTPNDAARQSVVFTVVVLPKR